MARLLNQSSVLVHPFIVGEIALGTLRQRGLVLSLLRGLPQADVAEHDEVLLLIDRYNLAGTGIGTVDAHILCATKLTAGARLWTRDKRLGAAARSLLIDYTSAS